MSIGARLKALKYLGPQSGTTPVKVIESVEGCLLAYGDSVPSDGTAGYCPGGMFIHVDGSAGTFLYCNEGTAASCDFDAVTVA